MEQRIQVGNRTLVIVSRETGEQLVDEYSASGLFLGPWARTWSDLDTKAALEDYRKEVKN